MRKNKKTLKIIIVIATLLLAIIATLEITNTTQLLHNDSSRDAVESTAETTSKAPSAQSDFSEGDPDKQPGNTLNENRGSATVEESVGAPATTNSSAVSDTGEITVYSPARGSVVSGNTILSGASTLPRVEYRITDSVSGVIATGSLSVKDGKFAGKISFDTNATDGRIELFATKADFSEYSYVEIPIKFKR